VIAADPARDMIFVPTGSASPDFYGGERPGNNGYANSVVAMQASTGKVLWAFQVVHHDLWDYDVASEPMLVDFKGTPAVAVTTKIGHMFVLDRMTGKSLLPIEERAVPKSHVPGEESSPTQPFPLYDAMTIQKITPDDAWGVTPEDKAWCKERLAKAEWHGLFTPPSLEGTLIIPGNVGGVNWGSSAYDPARGLLIAAANRLPTIVRLIPRDKLAAEYQARDNRLDLEFARQTGAPFAMVREHLRTSRGLPCTAPPWGTLVAMDLATGKKIWDVPLGGMPLPNGQSIPGMLAMGGPITTASGLIFIAATVTETKLRAFDAENGRELWAGDLPASAQSTPMTYSVGGKQYVVICAGGHGKARSKMGDSVVAFALP
jgi:quinoprotein glucose dehydrogenase